LDNEKAQRIIDAMAGEVGARGSAGATFDHVAKAAGVSRGLLHYYFGTKERLLAAVVRRHCDARREQMRNALAEAPSAAEVLVRLRAQLDSFLEEEARSALVFELWAASRHNEELRLEMAGLYRQVRDELARILAEKQAEGVLALRGGPDAVASVLLCLADGMVLQVLADPAWDSGPAIGAGLTTGAFLLGAPDPSQPQKGA